LIVFNIFKCGLRRAGKFHLPTRFDYSAAW
jgi:hypothetical protein